MRRLIRRFLPNHESIRDNRWLSPFSSTLLHPRLWYLNRRSAAGAVAVGLFCGLIPGPLQMLGAALCCLALRVNLPLALLTTLYTNPLTIVPLYIAGFAIGQRVLGNDALDFAPPPEFSIDAPLAWLHAMGAWAYGLGKPLFVGILVLASLLALLGYIAVKAA